MVRICDYCKKPMGNSWCTVTDAGQLEVWVHSKCIKDWIKQKKNYNICGWTAMFFVIGGMLCVGLGIDNAWTILKIVGGSAIIIAIIIGIIIREKNKVKED